MRLARFTGCAAVLAALLGCQTPDKGMEMKMPTAPAVPPEMSKLADWTGEWEGDFTMTPAGKDAKPMTMKGVSKIEPMWNGMFYKETSENDMGEMGKMSGVAYYWYDPREREYRTLWLSNWGEAMGGEMKYNEKTGEWRMTWKGKSPMDGSSTVGEGSMKMVDKNTMSWSMTEWDSMKLAKKMTGTGTAKRKK